MKIYIFGAAGSGTTTQGLHLAMNLNIPYFDSDNYFWEDTPVPFTIRRDPQHRNTMVKSDTNKLDSYVIGGGSLPNWNNFWLSAFDLVVFLYIPAEIRIKRLKERELERYGNEIFSNQARNLQYNEFIAWCTGYDNDTASGRTLSVHRHWIQKFNCPVLQILEDLPIQTKTDLILQQIG
ncbi:MAG: adenylate kinase [Mucilaginibacter sp.]|uniref:adenylate kinase n=1 Tax=Mucilaginibacter sp. TaxID=1882438 RepID=UPI003266CE00